MNHAYALFTSDINVFTQSPKTGVVTTLIAESSEYYT